MNESQKQLIREKFEREYPDLIHLPEGGMSVWLEESYMNGMVDFWLNELDLAIKQTEDRIVEKIQESFPEKNYIEMAELNDYYTGKENGVIYCKNKIITLIRNNG